LLRSLPKTACRRSRYRTRDGQDASEWPQPDHTHEDERQRCPHIIVFISKLIFERDNWYIRQLHSKAALTMLRRLHLRNMPVVILPMKL